MSDVSDYETVDGIEELGEYTFKKRRVVEEEEDVSRKRQNTATPDPVTDLETIVPKPDSIADSAHRDFEICTDVLEAIKLPRRTEVKYGCDRVFRITKLHYCRSFLYMFLTGIDNVQFYFKCYIQISSYKVCYRHPCRNNCLSYKSLVVTGLKWKECHRVSVMTIERSKCEGEKYLLDEFCNDVNRVQMQTEVYEGDYIAFPDGVEVGHNSCANGSLCDFKKVPLNELKEPIDPVTACYDLETYTDGIRFSNSDTDPVITISYVLRRQNNEVSRYCFINTNGRRFTLDDEYHGGAEFCDGRVTVVPFDNERDMLKTFLEVIWRTNPDEVIDYNGDKFDIPYIIGRCKQLGLDEKCIRRYDLERTAFRTNKIRTKFGYDFNSHSMVYYNHTDVYQFIKSSFDAGKMENLKLDTAATYYLSVGKVELSVKEMMRLYHEGRFAKIVKYNVRDSMLPMEIFFKCQVANKLYADAGIMYLTRDDYLKTISHKINLALFNRSIRNRGADGESDPYFFNKFDLNKIMGDRNKFAAVLARDEDEDEENAAVAEEEGEEINFTNLDRTRVPEHMIPEDARRLCPLKTRIKYTGGKVLSPRPGYYETTFTLDFSQLYTSIMIHITACMSNLFFGSDGYLYLQHNENAVTTKFLKDMAEQRANSKREMKKHHPSSFLYSLFDSWQNTNKLVCNSQYGWFGMFCKPLANEITMIGRQKLEEAKTKIEAMSGDEVIMKKWGLTKMGLTVVYGDTDSNFVSIVLVPEEQKRLGDEGLRRMILEDILAPVNAGWSGSFKMELENIMKCMLIKGKKAYMCLKENGSLYKRGFNVKKDVPLFLRVIFDDVIKMTLTNHSLDCVLKSFVTELKRKKDEFCVENCESYSFSQTLNEKKTCTIAYKLFMELRDNPDSKHYPTSGERIPYLLQDKSFKNVKDKAHPTYLFTDRHNMSWSKHLGIVCTFLNDIMAMLRNDTLFVLAFEQVCDYLQKDQVHDIVHPVLKKMTDSRVKDILCKELNIKQKKRLSEGVFQESAAEGNHKFVHTHEFTMGKTKASYRLNIDEFGDDCPVCTGTGVSAVAKQMELELLQPLAAPKKKAMPMRKRTGPTTLPGGPRITVVRTPRKVGGPFNPVNNKKTSSTVKN